MYNKYFYLDLSRAMKIIKSVLINYRITRYWKLIHDRNAKTIEYSSR